MNQSTDEFVTLVLNLLDVEFSKHNNPGYTGRYRLMDWPDDDPKAQAQGANLSMDEVRISLDEFEQIIHAKLNFCAVRANDKEAVVD